MVGSPEAFVKSYAEMLEAARKTKEWQDWKPTETFSKYLNAEYDKVFRPSRDQQANGLNTGEWKMSVDFKKLLQKPLDEVRRPPALPEGTYHGVITKFEYRESDFMNENTGEKDAQVRFHLRATSADPAIADQLNGIDLSKRPMRRDMPLSGGNEWVTKTFLDSLGIKTTGRTFDETIPEALNAAVQFEVTQRVDKKNPENIYNDVRTMKGQQ